MMAAMQVPGWWVEAVGWVLVHSNLHSLLIAMMAVLC